MEEYGNGSEELKEIREHNRKMLQDAAHAAALRKGLSTQGEAGQVQQRTPISSRSKNYFCTGAFDAIFEHAIR